MNGLIRRSYLPIGASLCDGTNSYLDNGGLNVHIYVFSGLFLINKVSNPIVLIPRNPLEEILFAQNTYFLLILQLC